MRVVRGEAQHDALVPDPFGEPVPDGSQDLPMVFLCAARMLCVEVLRPCQQLRSCRTGQLSINTVPGQA